MQSLGLGHSWTLGFVLVFKEFKSLGLEIKVLDLILVLKNVLITSLELTCNAYMQKFLG